MRRLLQVIVPAGLTLSLGYAVFARGAVSRVHFAPVAILIALMFAMFLITINHDLIRPRFNARTDLPLLGLLLWAGLSFFSSINQEQTYFELIKLTALIGAYFLTAYSLRRSNLRTTLAICMFAIAFLEAIYGLAVYIAGSQFFNLAWFPLPRAEGMITGTYGNRNHFAGLVEMSVPMGLGMIDAMRRSEEDIGAQASRSLLLTLPSAIMVLALILTLSRGGWLSMAGGLAVFVILVGWRSRPSPLRVAALAATMLTVMGVTLFGLDRQPLAERIKEIGEIYEEPAEITRATRISLWKSSLEMIRDHPVTGIGLGGFKSAYPSYRRDYIFKGPRFAHNDYLQIAAETGLPGLGLFLLFLVMLFREGFKVIQSGRGDFWTKAMPGMMAGMFAVLVHELADFNLMIPANALFFFTMAGMVTARARRVK